MPVELTSEHDYKKDCFPNFDENLKQPRHRWYDFKEGFSSLLVERAINETKRNLQKERLTVLDPFSGSGTTPLTALQYNCDAIGLDVNPFMLFVGQTKCNPKDTDYEVYLRELNHILAQFPKLKKSALEDESTFCEKDGRTKWLFNKKVLKAFEALKYQIEIANSHKDLFMLALISATMQCCNAEKDGKCLRYKKDWQNQNFDNYVLRELFKKNCLDFFADIIAEPLSNAQSRFYLGSSKRTIRNVTDKTVDLIVFSPPYLNTFDYSDIYRPELYLCGHVKDNSDLRNIRKETLRSHVQHIWNTQEKSDSVWAQEIAQKIASKKDELWNQYIPTMINEYFFDMERILEQSYRVAHRGTELWFVVSTSAYAGIEIPVDLILADIAERKGWQLKSVNVLRKLRTSSQCVNEDVRKIRLRESLIICEK